MIQKRKRPHDRFRSNYYCIVRIGAIIFVSTTTIILQQHSDLFPCIDCVEHHLDVNTNDWTITSELSKNHLTLRQVAVGLDTTTSTTTARNVTCHYRHIYIPNIDRLDTVLFTNSWAFKKSGVHTIPKIIHQTSKARCVTYKVAKAIQHWRDIVDGVDHSWSYFFHDDDAVMRLFQNYTFPEFPLLQHIVKHCLLHGTVKADLWRYLILWTYGGIYADIDTIPNQDKFNATDIVMNHHDAYFVVEQYHMLSQWFIAVSPRHPLMYYAVQQSLSNLFRLIDTGSIAASIVTGPHALHAAYAQFRNDAGPAKDMETITPRKKPIRAGQYVGAYNRTVTVVGSAEHENEYVIRDVLGVLKQREYKKMGMRHFQDDKSYPSGSSCMSAILHAYM
jgi:mannosyltransferase OCH1-like enzyme